MRIFASLLDSEHLRSSIGLSKNESDGRERDMVSLTGNFIRV